MRTVFLITINTETRTTDWCRLAPMILPAGTDIFFGSRKGYSGMDSKVESLSWFEHRNQVVMHLVSETWSDKDRADDEQWLRDMGFITLQESTKKEPTMSETNQPTHTPGPLTVDEHGTISDGKNIRDANKIAVCACSLSHVRGFDEDCDNADANARLLCAAYNSYDKHLGPNAVQAAESDYLGRAVEALKRVIADIDWWAVNRVDREGPNQLQGYEDARALLSELQPKGGA